MLVHGGDKESVAPHNRLDGEDIWAPQDLLGQNEAVLLQLGDVHDGMDFCFWVCCGRKNMPMTSEEAYAHARL